jgi:hypothetical protein
VQHALADDEALQGQELGGPALEVDREPAVDHIEELVVVVVLPRRVDPGENGGRPSP